MSTQSELDRPATPTAQEIFEKEGFIPWCTQFPCEIGEVLEEQFDDGLIPQGAKGVVVGELSLQEARAFAARYGLATDPPKWARHFYKVVAE